MNIVSLSACAVALWHLGTRDGSRLRSRVLQLRPSAAVARIAMLALVAMFALQLAAVAAESRLEGAAPGFAWVRALPIPVYSDRSPLAARFAWLALTLGACETVAVSVVVLRLRRECDAATKRLVFATACVLALLATLAPAMSTTDPYEYAATGLLGFHAYAPVPGAFAGTVYAAFRDVVPLRGVIYGPLWVLVDIAQTNLGSSLYQKIEAIRLTNVCLAALLLWLLSLGGVSRAARAGLAINPCLWLYTVADPHADVEGLVLLAAAYACARRSNVAFAMSFIVAAGLVKLPFAFIGGAVLAPLAGTGRRLGAWCASLAAVLVISHFVAGPAYFRALSAFTAQRVSQDSHAGWYVVAALAAGAVVLLCALQRGVFGAAWLLQQIPMLAFPWYLYWGVPYALVTGALECYVAAMPLAASLLGDAANDAIWNCVFVAVTICATTDLYLTKRRPFAATAHS